MVGLVDSPSESSESLSPSPSLAGHQNQQVGLDNQQGGGYNTSIIQGSIEKITAIRNYNNDNARYLTIYTKHEAIEGLTPTEKDNLINALGDNYTFNGQIQGDRRPTINFIYHLASLTKDYYSRPIISGLIEKITAIIAYNKNNDTDLTLYSEHDGFEGLTLTENDNLIRAVGYNYTLNDELQGDKKPSKNLVIYLATLRTDPPAQ